MKTCTALEARKWFGSKARTNWGITIIVFSALLLVLAQFNAWWLAAAISVAAACCLFFLILGRRSIGIECPNCGRIVESNTPWVCGFKQCHNENTHTFPFINECEHCHYIPKAYECHHCGKLIYLSKDKQNFQFAKILISPKFTEVKRPPEIKDVSGDKSARQREEKQDLRHKLEVTKIESDIILEKNRAIKLEEVSICAQLREELERLYNQKMGKEDAAEWKKAEIRKKYAGNDFEIDRRCAMVDQIMLDQL